jgi:hypothetical protein
MGVVEHDVQLRLHQDGDELTGRFVKTDNNAAQSKRRVGILTEWLFAHGLLGETEPCVCFSMLRNRACLSVMFVALPDRECSP